MFYKRNKENTFKKYLGNVFLVSIEGFVDLIRKCSVINSFTFLLQWDCNEFFGPAVRIITHQKSWLTKSSWARERACLTTQEKLPIIRVTQVLNNIFPKWLSKIEFFNLIPEMVLFLLCDKYSITKARSNIGLF